MWPGTLLSICDTAWAIFTPIKRSMNIAIMIPTKNSKIPLLVLICLMLMIMVARERGQSAMLSRLFCFPSSGGMGGSHWRLFILCVRPRELPNRIFMPYPEQVISG